MRTADFEKSENIATGQQSDFCQSHFSKHLLTEAQAAGLGNWDILKMATTGPTIFLEETDTFGAIKEGLEADLVLLKGNPVKDMENLKNPVGVILIGRWLDRNFIQGELDKIKLKYQE